MSEANAPALTIDVVSDVVCPWCFIGKRNLEAALQGLATLDEVVVRWHPFELNPDLPEEGVDRKAYLEAKFGGPERARQIYTRVREAGERAGIAFDFDAIPRQPNTREAHRLMGAEHDEIRGMSSCVEQNHARSVALLNADPH